MKYKEKLIDLILNATNKEFSEWIHGHEPMEQVEVMRQLKEITEENMFASDDYSIAETLSTFDDKIDTYQDLILDEMNAEREYLKAVDDAEAKWQEIVTTMAGSRAYIIECIVTNADNAPEMRKLAKELIKFEQNCEIYDPENWKAIDIQL